MKALKSASLAIFSLSVFSMVPFAVAGEQPAQQAPTIKVPEPGVPQLMTLEGTWTRVAYNNEGYVIIGYRLVNMSIGEEWILLEFGTTVRDRVPDYTLRRDAITLDTPDGKTVPLASVMEYRKGNLAALQAREKVQRDSIDYFPPSVSRPCRAGFFSELGDRAMAYDEVELSSERGCVGRLFFHVPGGITHGQHWLNVKFEKSLIRVPFRVLTKDEEKLLSKNFKDIKRQVENAFKTKS